ncbi:MAG: hypothetical protein HQ463_06290 [Bacteroidetes bacterium]|nr:hypothetical protein [Bacteroidota bacterium]
MAHLLKANDTACIGKLDKKNQKQGLWKCKVNSKLIKTERFKHGLLVSWIVFNAKGEIIETRDKKGTIRKYKPCGC